MAGRTNHRVQSASALMALLLALAAIATASATLEGVATGGALMRRSLATSDALEECADEIQACFTDDSCIECEEAFLANVDGCTGGADLIPCDEAQEATCCALTDEAEECVDDVLYANYLECWNAEFNSECTAAGYTVDLSDCNGAVGRATAWGLPSTLVSATAVGALLVTAFGSPVV